MTQNRTGNKHSLLDCHRISLDRVDTMLLHLGLGVEDRKVLICHYQEDMCCEKISERLDLSVVTVKKRLLRAKKIMLKRLEEVRSEK